MLDYESMDCTKKGPEEADSGDSERVQKSIVLLKSVQVLHEGFDLQRMPQNYLNKRSCIEKLIFHAAMSDAFKSPFSGFTIANRFLATMDSADVISGIRSLKALAKIAISSNQRTSVMVHRIGNTWLLDDFDVDSFLLAGEQSRDWHWLRKFLTKENIFLCAEAFSRNALILRDLYIKFLYHTVNQSPHAGLQLNADQGFDIKALHRSLPAPSPNDSGSEWDSEPTEGTDCCCQLASSADAPAHSTGYNDRVKRGQKRSWAANPDEFLHTAKWQLQDLSFLVGSDLAIFGTPKHPCISLKLSPLHESINVLTGIDIWLENILNEVPEVAMCYHHEGIVMQEYELYKTCDIPTIAGFKTEQICRIVQNIIMFLKRNATQEGHTYWLVKEPECGLVKLYDLTTLCDSDRFINAVERDIGDSDGINPFILPVATLCYRLAELRWDECQLDRESKLVGPSNSNRQSEQQLNNLTDALRLIRNCLNVINLAERGVSGTSEQVKPAETIPPALSNLKTRAVLLLCRLYLTTPYSLLSKCIIQADTKPSCDVVSLNVEDLAQPSESAEDVNAPMDSAGTPVTDDDSSLVVASKTAQQFKKYSRKLLGNLLLDAFKSADTSRICQLASSVLESCNTAIPIHPTTCDSDYSSSCEALSHFRSNSHSSSTILLSTAMVKVYLSKAQDCWMRSQNLGSGKSSQPIAFTGQIRIAFRYLLSSLVLLEHLLPDVYSNAFSPTVSANSQIPTCPYCGEPGILFQNTKARHSVNVDSRALGNFLRIASCLLPAVVVFYADAVRQVSREEYTSKLKKPTLEHSDRVLLQAACLKGMEHFTQLHEAVMAGPYFCKVGDEPPEGPAECSQWLRVLHLTARCLLRVFQTRFRKSGSDEKASGTHTSSKRGKHRKQTDTISGAAYSDCQPLFDLSAHESNLTVSYHWWPALVNMYVLSLRKKLFYKMDSNESLADDEFCTELDQALSLIAKPALNINQLIGTSQFLTSMNEFQLYKLAAVVSQSHTTGSWTRVFRSYQSDETPILPLAALIWTGDEDDPGDNSNPPSEAVKHKSTKSSTQSARFSLTSVCLARAIESVLRHFSILESRNSTSGELDLQSSTCLLIAANEYIPSCTGESDSEQNSEYINTLYTVIKQITRRLPEEFVGNPAQRPISPTIKMSRNLIVHIVDFRLNHVKVALLKFCQHSITDRGQSSSPMWFTIVNQARTAIGWYFTHIPLPSSKEESCDPIVVKDMIACLNLVHRLVFMQAANFDVLSLSGVMNTLKDLLMTQRVVQILKDLPDSALKVDTQKLPEYHLQFLFFYLVVTCQLVSSKYRSKSGLRTDRKSGGSRRKSISKAEASGSAAQVPSPEVELTDRILADPPFLNDPVFDNYTKFVQALKDHNLDSFHPLCTLFAQKLDLLRQYFS